MSALLEKTSRLVLGKGEIAVIWLGQAGFMFKDRTGTVVTVDPYLTDSCERIVGFKRLMPGILEPDELNTDILITTHSHPDHLDMDAVPAVMANPRTMLFGSVTAVQACIDAGISSERLVSMAAGDIREHCGIKIKAVFADHGELAPDALGIILDIDGIRIYFAGDTAYTPGRMSDAINCKPDIAILPINGAYGNLDGKDAAKLAADLGTGIVIPCHFWTFMEHGGDPQEFANEMKGRGLGGRVRFMTQGEVFQYKNKKVV